LTAPQASGRRRKGAPSPLARFFAVEGVPIAIVFLVLVGIFMITAPQAFLGYRVYMSFMATVPPPLIIALGVTLVAVAGEMDLSFPSVVAGASYTFGILYQTHDLAWLALLAALLVGGVMGTINGLVVTLLGIPSLIATLAMLFLWGGLITVVSGGMQLAIPDIYGSALHTVMVGRIGGVFPAQMLWALAISVFIWFLLNRHRFGESLLFIGDSLEVARMVGINATREKIKLFALSGTLAALGGVFLTLETTAYFSTQGMGYLLTVIAAVFIGGTSIFGGSGKVIGTVFAAFIVTVIEAGLVASGIQGFWTRFFIGLVFVLSVTMNTAIEDPEKVPLIRMLRQRR
jgi:simple sugar transport system permease protein